MKRIGTLGLFGSKIAITRTSAPPAMTYSTPTIASGYSLRQIDARQAAPDNAGCHQQTYDSLQIEHPTWPRSDGAVMRSIHPAEAARRTGMQVGAMRGTHAKLRSMRCPISHLSRAP